MQPEVITHGSYLRIFFVRRVAKGELLAELLTDFPDRFDGREDLFLAPPGFQGTLSWARPVAVISSWLPVGKNRGRIVLHLAGIDTISRGRSLWPGSMSLFPKTAGLSLDEDSIYISDLIGAFFDDETSVGEVSGREFPASLRRGHDLDDMPLF